MNILHTIYRLDTGEIIQSGWGEPVVPEGTGCAVGQFDGATHFIDETGAPQPLPPRPGDWAAWTRGGWIDPRTTADLAAEKWARRAAAAPLSRTEFFLATVRARIITQADARLLIAAQIPESLAPLLANLPESWLFDAEMRVRGAAEFSRMDPLVVIFASEVPLPEGAPSIDDILDMAFGIIPWGPEFPPI